MNQVQIINIEQTATELNAMLLVEPTGEHRFKYTVITRDNGHALHFSPAWWENHPEYAVFIRSNVISFVDGRKRYQGAGGADRENALQRLCESIAAMMQVRTATGEESATPIDMEAERNIAGPGNAAARVG